MVKKAAVVLLIIFMIVSCASGPEGFDNAKAGAAQAQQRALDVGADKEVPARYGEAESAMALAQEKEAAGELEESMELYQQAEVKYNVAAAETEKKMRVDEYMNDLTPLLQELEAQVQ